jgi:hypothetical protein
LKIKNTPVRTDSFILYSKAFNRLSIFKKHSKINLNNDHGVSMHVKYIRLKPFIVATLITAAIVAPACAQVSSGEHAAPAYTATQTKGEMIYQNDDTAISVMGSLRLMAKDDSAHSVEHNIQNNDSRLSVALRHNINDKGYYAAGYYETGIHGLEFDHGPSIRHILISGSLNS